MNLLTIANRLIDAKQDGRAWAAELGTVEEVPTGPGFRAREPHHGVVDMFFGVDRETGRVAYVRVTFDEPRAENWQALIDTFGAWEPVSFLGGPIGLRRARFAHDAGNPEATCSVFAEVMGALNDAPKPHALTFRRDLRARAAIGVSS